MAEQYLYRITTTASGRKRAEVFDSEKNTWKVVGLRNATNVIAKGLGKLVPEEAGV